MNRFAQKTVLVTGAGTGIGRAAALRLAGEGAYVLLVGRRSAPLAAVAEEITADGGQATAISCDISSEPSVLSTIDRVTSEFGAIDALFANAGVLGEFRALENTPADQFDELLTINLKGTFLMIRHCLPVLKSGAILINASWTIHGIMPGAGAYAASKGALAAMMRTLAVEVGSRGIRVNTINPGIILTPMADDVLDADIAARLAAHTPLRRNGVPDDIAGTVAWLLSEDAAFVTGQEITIDGGYTLGGLRL